MKIMDMPKLQSPFVRKVIDGNYIVTPEITEGYEWVFENPKVLATEKLDGTNVSVVIENGYPTSVWNRTGRVPFFNKGKGFIIEGLLNSYERGYLELPDGQHFGELIGPKLNSNPYGLDKHLWLPFETYAQKHLAYNSWGKYPKTFDVISKWFEEDLFSLFIRRTQDKVKPPEGIVFVNPETGDMAKLRRDMFSWWSGDRHKTNADLDGVVVGFIAEDGDA